MVDIMPKKPTYKELEEAELERSQAEKALREIEEKYRTILDGIEDSYLEVDLGGNFISFNSSFCKLIGYSTNELLGRNNREFVDKENAQKIFQIFHNVYKTGKPAKGVGWEFIRKDGSKRHIEASVSLVKDSNGERIGFRGIGRDITEHKRILESLSQSEIKHKRLIKNIPGMVYKAYPDWSAEIFGGCEKVSGYTEFELYSKDKGWLSIIHPDDIERVYKEGSILATKPKDLIQTYRIISKDGETRWVEDRKTSVFSEEGEFMGIDGVVFDVTKRKQAEESLQNREAKLSTIIDKAPVMIDSFDLNGKCLMWNEECARQLGWTFDEIKPVDNSMALFYPDSADIEQVFISLAKADGTFREYTVQAKDGSLKNQVWADFQLPDKSFISIGMDITERKKTEERYRSLVENTIEGFFICEIPSGKFLFLNQRSCEIYGYTLKDGLKLTIWDIISSEDHERVKNRIQKRLTGEKLSSERQSYNSVHKDKSTIRVEISTSLVTYKDRPAVQGVIRDITEQERLELQLQQLKKMEAIGLLAGGVAHDLNNILSGIVSYPDLLLMDLPEESPLRKPIHTIRESGQKAAEIVQDLLTLARRGVSNKNVLNINNVVLDYLKSPEYAKFSSYHSKVSVKSDLNKNLLNIEGSPTQLLKMLMNLVSNAAEAQPTGGNITISTRNKYIDTPIHGYEEIKEGDFVVLEIKDSGLGIATNNLDRIFEPFYTKKIMGRSGTGLGMAVVWGTVHDHDGYIDIKSTEGVGTTFSIYFPVTRHQQLIKKDFIPVEEYLGREEKILVVDDILEQREIAATILSKLNYSVKTLSSGEDAIEYLKDNSADLLILDMIMDPGIDGLETYRRIKKLHPNQKAIIASGYSETDRVKEAKKLGAGRYIRKPYTLEKIGLAVKAEFLRI